MERRLGRGLGSLLGTSTDNEETPTGTLALPIEKIMPNREQPRKVFDQGGLEELRDSILEHGILQPVVVREVEQGYELIAGERRWRCARLAGLKEIPAIVRSVKDQERLELALVENVQRRDLDAMEKARGYRRLQESLGLTQEQVAKKVGLKRATIANHVRLLDLPQDTQDALSQGLISMGHARALLAVSDSDRHSRMLEEIVRGDLSVRDAERAIRGELTPKAAPGADTTVPTEEPAAGQASSSTLAEEAPWLQDLQRRMQIHLGTKVSMANRDGFKGKIVIEYYGREDLDRLLEVLAPRDEIS